MGRTEKDGARHDRLRKCLRDLGFPDPETELAKANIVIAIDEVIENRGLTHAGAARTVAMPLQELTKLLRGHTKPSPSTRLKELLSRLSV